MGILRSQPELILSERVNSQTVLPTGLRLLAIRQLLSLAHSQTQID